MKKAWLALALMTLIFPVAPANSATSAASPTASPATTPQVKRLVERIRARLQLLAEQPLFRLIPSQDGKPRQGEAFTVFAQPESKLLKANAILSATLDGQPVALDALSADLWAFTHPGFHEIRPHAMVWTFHIEDADEAAQIRAALKTLDKEIAALQKLIDKTPPGSVRDEYVRQRDDKIALKNVLLENLEELKKFVGTQELAFEVVANPQGESYPRITSVLPNVGSVNGGTEVSLQGANFAGTPQVEIGGFSVGAQLISPSEVRFTTPVFGTLGAKDVALSFTQENGTVKNAILKNAFFAGVEPEPVPNFPPQASAGPSLVLNPGQVGQLSGHGFDANGDSLEHSWRIVSVAEGSQLVPGTVIASTAAVSFQPDVPGWFVLGYKVRESETGEHLESFESLTTVRQLPSQNRAPEVVFTPASLEVPAWGTASVSVQISDPDTWQRTTVTVAKQPQRGGVLFDGTTLTFSSNGDVGEDSVVLAVADNAEPPAITLATLPITITNQAPIFTSDLLNFQMSEGSPLQIRWNVFANDPDGTISQVRYNYGDGTWGYGNPATSAVATSFHDYVTSGPFTGQVWVRDNNGLESTLVASSPMDLTARFTNKRPVNRVTASAISGAAPLTVTFNGSASFDPDGTIAAVRWNFGDGVPDLVGGVELLTTEKTFTNPGTYNVRFRLRDNLNAESDHLIAIYVDGTPPTGGTPPTADFVPTPREVILGSAVSFDGTRSNDPNPDAASLTYAWRVFDGVTCASEPGAVCAYTGTTASHSFGAVGNYYPSLIVTNQNGAASASKVWEVHVVNQGHAPRALFSYWPNAGAAPLTVNLDAPAGLSFDYDGTITSHLWDFGDGTPTSNNQTLTHTYTSPGVYFVRHTVTDNDGNKHTQSQSFTVNPSVTLQRTPPPDDEERASRRELLTNACGQGQGEACYWLGKMYEEDGDAFTAQKILERACQLGHAPACSSAPWAKW